MLMYSVQHKLIYTSLRHVDVQCTTQTHIYVSETCWCTVYNTNSYIRLWDMLMYSVQHKLIRQWDMLMHKVYSAQTYLSTLYTKYLSQIHSFSTRSQRLSFTQLQGSDLNLLAIVPWIILYEIELSVNFPACYYSGYNRTTRIAMHPTIPVIFLPPPLEGVKTTSPQLETTPPDFNRKI